MSNELLRAEMVINTDMSFVFTCSRTLKHLTAGGRVRVLAEQPFYFLIQTYESQELDNPGLTLFLNPAYRLVLTIGYVTFQRDWHHQIDSVK